MSVPLTSTQAGAAPRAGGLGLVALFAVAIGVVVSQLGMVSLMQGVGVGGWGFFAALFIALCLALSNALAYAELALMMPKAESLGSYVESAIGHFPAILLIFAGYVAPALFGLPVELILVDGVMQQIVPGVLPPFGWAVALLAVLVLLNLMGTDIFAKVQTALTFVMLVFMAVTAATVLSGHGSAAPAAGAGFVSLGENTAVLSLIALAFWVFVGTEFVTPLVVEARAPQRDLPRAMVWGLLAVFLVQTLFALGAAALLPREQLATSATPHVDYVVAAFGSSARIWFGVIAITATASLVNTVLAAVPRMLHGMAMNGQVFPVFKRLSRRGTPVVAILFVAALPLLGLVWSGGDSAAILPLAVAASVAWLLAYITSQVSLLVLRHRHPALARPFRMPAHPWLPLAAIAGMVYVVSNSSPSPELTSQILRYTGIVLGLFSVVGACWVKLVMKKNLFQAGSPTRWC